MKTNKMEVTGGGQCKLKLLAAVAVLAMVFCAFSAVTPVSEGATGEKEVNDLTTLESALADSSVSKIILISDITLTKNIDINRAVTITANDGVTVNGGAFNVKETGVIIDGVDFKTEFISDEDAGNKNERNAINVLTSSVTIKNCSFTTTEPTDVTNGVFIFPTGENQNYVIAGNKFTGYTQQTQGQWNLTGIGVAENQTFASYSGYDARFGTEFVKTFKSTEMTMSEAEQLRMVKANTFTNCQDNYHVDDWTDTSGDVVMIVDEKSGTTDAGIDYFVIEDGAYKLLAQASARLTFDLASDEKLIIANGVTFTGTVSFGNDEAAFAGVTAGSGLTMFDGSLGMSGEFSAGTVTATSGTTVHAKDLTMSGTAGVELADEKAKFVAEDVTDKRTDTTKPLVTYTNGSAAPIETVGDKYDAYLGGEIAPGKGEDVKNLYFGENNIVNITDSLVIMKGATVTIMGDLVVPEGMTITIQAGGKLVLSGAASNAEINGSIIIDGANVDAAGNVIEGEGAGIFEISGSNAEVIVDGSVQVDGVLDLVAGTIVFNSAATISEVGVVKVKSGVIEVAETGDLTIEGWINKGLTESLKLTIENYGIVTFDSMNAVGQNTYVNIYQMKSGASIVIENYTVSSNSPIDIYESRLEIKGKDTVSSNTVRISPEVIKDKDTEYDSAKGAVVSGVSITTTAVIKDNTVKTEMDISGNIDAVMKTENGTTENDPIYAQIDATNGKNLVVSTELTLGEYANLKLGTSTNLTVSGKIIATADGAGITNNATKTDGVSGITVEGDGIISVNNNAPLGLVNATKYTVKTTDGKSKIDNYVTLDAALTLVNEDTTITALTAYGEQKLTESNTVPAKVTLTIDQNAVISIGCEDHNKVQLTIEKEGKMTGTGSVDVVDGVVLAKDKTKVSVKIDSDVTSYEIDADGKIVRNGWQKWTTLAIALDEANPGDVIVISGNEVEIDSNLTIDEGVTVKVPAGKFTIMDGVTFTIDGVLETEIDIGAETRFAGTAADRFEAEDPESTDSSVIVINGQIKTAVGFRYNVETEKDATTDKWANTSLSAGAPVSCAVFKDAEDYTVISPLAVALENIADANTDITLYGTIAAGDIVFEANEDGCDELIVDSGAKFTANSVKLVNSTLRANGTFAGSITVGDVTVNADCVKNLVVGDDDGAMKFTDLKNIASGYETKDGKQKSANLALVSGTLVGKSDLDMMTVTSVDFTVAAGATLVAEGASFGDLVIEGTVTVAKDGTLTATNVTITGGTLSVAAATSTEPAGTVTIDTLNAGVEVKDSTGASATVNGPVPVNEQMFVAADATLDEAALNALEGYKSTAMYVGDALWLTIYDKNGTYTFTGLTGAENFDIPVKDAKFDNQWNNEDGDPVEKVSDATKAYAKIQYDVYDVTIYANEGVNDIFIDGQILVKEGNTYTLAAGKLKAGTHEVTFELNNGFTGEGKLAIVGAVTEGINCGIDGLDFTLSGTPNDNNWNDAGITLQLTGIEKSGFTPDQPDTPAADNGMTITDYLLIILVVLIVVMAIIVAMRLMRS